MKQTDKFKRYNYSLRVQWVKSPTVGFTFFLFTRFSGQKSYIFNYMYTRNPRKLITSCGLIMQRIDIRHMARHKKKTIYNIISSESAASIQPQALHQPRHTRHSLHAGSGAGCVMYTDHCAMPPVSPAISHLAGCGACAFNPITVTSRKHHSSASMAFVRGIHRVDSPQKWPVTRKMFPFDDVIMFTRFSEYTKIYIWVNRPATPQITQYCVRGLIVQRNDRY